MYKILKTDGRAKRAEFTTVHGTVQTPVFMNVGTVAAIKGAVATTDLQQIGTQIELSNTYHLHVRPGDKIIKQLGGLHKFMNWNKPILTDSGGFQVFSLAGLRKIKEEGVTFQSHIDGHKIFMGPEESMQIQSNLGSTITMARSCKNIAENPFSNTKWQKGYELNPFYMITSLHKTTAKAPIEIFRLAYETGMDPDKIIFPSGYLPFAAIYGLGGGGVLSFISEQYEKLGHILIYEPTPDFRHFDPSMVHLKAIIFLFLVHVPFYVPKDVRFIESILS
jgi:hypothetical protein